MFYNEEGKNIKEDLYKAFDKIRKKENEIMTESDGRRRFTETQEEKDLMNLLVKICEAIELTDKLTAPF